MAGPAAVAVAGDLCVPLVGVVGAERLVVGTAAAGAPVVLFGLPLEGGDDVGWLPGQEDAAGDSVATGVVADLPF
jgi:hypothetical protein